MYKAHQVRTTFGSCDVDKVHAVVSRSTFLSQNAHRTSFGRWDVEKVHAVVARSTFASEKSHVRTAFGSLAVEKVHAIVARSTFRSQNVKSTSGSDHFWKLRCRKSACRFGAKHISKSKCTKHTILRRLLEVEMSKKCAKHISKPKCTKHTRGSDHFWKVRCRKSARCCGAKHIYKWKISRPDRFWKFSCWKTVHAVVARSTFRSQNVKSTSGSDHFWKLRCRKSACRCGTKHISKWKCEKHQGSDHFWTFRCRFAWQVQGIVDLVKREQNVPKRSG